MQAQEYWDRKLETLAPATQLEYRRHFGNFLEWADLTPEELYDKTVEALASKDKRDGDDIQYLAKGYMRHMEEQGRAPSTRNNFLKSLVSFLNKANKLGFDADELWEEKSYRGSKKISHEQLLEIYRYCQRGHKLRNRALILFLKDSGLRVSDAIALNVGDYRNTERFIYGEYPYAWFNPQRTKKTKSDAYPCIGEESINALNEYLEERGVIAHDAPLFIDGEGKRLSRGSATMQFQRLRKTLKKPQKISAHSLRKFHTTSLQSAGMEIGFVHCLQGKTRSEYITPYDDDTLKIEYANGYHALRIFPYGQTEKQDEQIAYLQAQIDRMESMLKPVLRDRENARKFRKLKEEPPRSL